MKRILILLFMACALVNCVKKKQIIEFKIDIKAKRITDDSLQVQIQTNFPNKTPLTITASRNYKRLNNPEEYSGQLYYSYKSLVKNGMVEFTFNIDDQKWLNEYAEIQKQNLKFDKSLTDVDFTSIKDTIEINVLYTPMMEQNLEIKRLIGEKGENLNGDGVESNGSFKVFSKTIKIYDNYN